MRFETINVESQVAKVKNRRPDDHEPNKLHSKFGIATVAKLYFYPVNLYLLLQRCPFTNHADIRTSSAHLLFLFCPPLKSE